MDRGRSPSVKNDVFAVSVYRVRFISVSVGKKVTAATEKENRRHEAGG